ncbi:TIR-like protein FxsC [Streptacidiphilus anmyonensis]|uniref:TIR-like protein FxsC n=1 Tax=Streptacidiphilus anmyonensis TaxID=405782 RepID=UPI000B09A275|nr:TIR-like protein FxsC [Streptacidiphilus anmyonensis]
MFDGTDGEGRDGGDGRSGGDAQEGVNRPYFFLSHAHSPGLRGGSRRLGRPAKLVRRLFFELSDHLGELCPPIGTVPVGMMDGSIEVGEDWGQWLSQQLAQCRVLVALLSPGYFASEMCGKEWAAFSARPVRLAAGVEAGRAAPTAIVPVRWVPTPPEQMPPPVRRLQYQHGDFPESYRSQGLYALMARPAMKPDRRETVYLLAERIKEVAGRTVVEEGEAPDLAKVPSAFAPSARERLPRLRPTGVPHDDPAGKGDR